MLPKLVKQQMYEGILASSEFPLALVAVSFREDVCRYNVRYIHIIVRSIDCNNCEYRQIILLRVLTFKLIYVIAAYKVSLYLACLRAVVDTQ